MMKYPIKFPFKPDRASQSILGLLHRHGGSMDKLKLIKIIFLADREHLVKYGRPIVGGNYVAMDLGLVSSSLKNYIEGKVKQKQLPASFAQLAISAYGIKDNE